MLASVDVLVVGGGATGAGLLRDLSRRGLRCLLVEKGDLGSGTSGRYHGLLHSGGRYVVKDPSAARECVDENRILRRIAPGTIEATGGWFVQTPDDPDEYADGFAAACAACGVECEEVPPAELRRREPLLRPDIRRAFRVPDASMEPWQLIEANLADARAHGAEARAYTRLVGFERGGDRLMTARLADERSGTEDRVAARFVVSAAGAWAGQVAALAGAELRMSPGKGTMLVFNERLTDTVVNRLHPPGDGDIMVPVHTVAILGTTEIKVDDPDRYPITRDEVVGLLREGEKLFPDLSRLRILRAYAGVRPLYDPNVQGLGGPDGAGDSGGPDGAAAETDGRAISRSHAVIDHAARDGIENLVSIVGGKLTTYRLMAEQTADLVCRRLEVGARCTTAEAILPGQEPGHHYWLGHRLAELEAAGGGDAQLICECELVTRPQLERFLDARWPCDLDDVRRGTRLGMGPCQGGFCTFRAAGLIAERAARPGDVGTATAASADAALRGFLRERHKGGRAVAWGRQLQELWMVNGIYWGTLGVGALPSADLADAGVDAGLGDAER